MLRPTLLAMLCLAAPALAKPAQVFPLPIEQHTLPNGLRVAFVTYDSPGLAGYYTLVRVGSRNEPEPGRSGYAHFFEHMMFRGTKQHSGDEYESTLLKLGLDTNAYTDDDLTVYHLFGPTRALPTIIDYEADRFQHLDYDEPAFKTEAGAILGEYAKSASNPDQAFEEKMGETAFTKHTYGHTTIGYLADIKAMPSGYAYSREFFRRYYTPDNCTIVVAGDFDHAATLARITAAYGAWQGKLDAVPVPVEPPQTAPRRARVDFPAPTLSQVWLAWHAPADVQSAAIQTVLGPYLFGATSPAYQDLILGRQLVAKLDTPYYDHRDPSLFSIVATVKSESNLPAVEETLRRAVAELQGGAVDRARLDAVRSNLTYGQRLRLITADRIAAMLARSGCIRGDVDWLNDVYAHIDALTAADLIAFARQHLGADAATTVTLIGKGGAR